MLAVARPGRLRVLTVVAAMRKIAAFVCVWATAWCSQAVVAAAAAAAVAATVTGAGGRSDSGNFLDDKQWLTTISQYDKEVGQWNKFRDEVNLGGAGCMHQNTGDAVRLLLLSEGKNLSPKSQSLGQPSLYKIHLG
ncbi:hypothetical protein lerEdw1_012151 [Lerista edwardsae]|nr:hypothetical protein lerEdw1_012151 [Lerista edwardsae]